MAAGAQGSGPSPYTECGIGASIFKDTDWAAATSNVTWDLGTTALSSASYSPEMCSPKKVKAAMLIRDNYAQISEEIARGQGDHLSAALEVFGCSAVAQPVAATQVRGEFGRMVSTSSYGGQSQIQKAGQMYQVIQSAAQGRCGA
uniref:DUF3015 domain-containing protein n=1 Tax=Curvibacter symbiont subsp. Hydra magnipapillata TaxID=667019 RepID=C9Y7L9_CURXX|nr:hypothetical protein Csp_A01200 [Curvibacter putative symbiont of Hydra magnipapillata]